jgi:hypothetical protein
MAKGILYVESRPASAQEAEDFHTWYEQTHMKEMLAVEGVVSARRFAPLGTDGPFVAIYELEGDDLGTVRSRVTEANRAGRISAPVGVQVDPPPVVRYLGEIAALA